MPRRHIKPDQPALSEGDLELCSCGHEHWLHFMGGGYCEEVVPGETRSGRARCPCRAFVAEP